VRQATRPAQTSDRYVAAAANFSTPPTIPRRQRICSVEFARAQALQWCSATKYTLTAASRRSNSGGISSQEHCFYLVEASLARMQTDYSDLLYLHVWDATTPPEESAAMDDLVRAGSPYGGISDTLRWHGVAQGRRLRSCAAGHR